MDGCAMRDAAPPDEACAIGGTLGGNPGETAIGGRLPLGEGLTLGIIGIIAWSTFMWAGNGLTGAGPETSAVLIRTSGGQGTDVTAEDDDDGIDDDGKIEDSVAEAEYAEPDETPAVSVDVSFICATLRRISSSFFNLSASSFSFFSFSSCSICAAMSAYCLCRGLGATGVLAACSSSLRAAAAASFALDNRSQARFFGGTEASALSTGGAVRFGARSRARFLKGELRERLVVVTGTVSAAFIKETLSSSS